MWRDELRPEPVRMPLTCFEGRAQRDPGLRRRPDRARKPGCMPNAARGSSWCQVLAAEARVFNDPAGARGSAARARARIQ